MLWSQGGNYTPLYSGLSERDIGEITAQLDGSGVNVGRVAHPLFERGKMLHRAEHFEIYRPSQLRIVAGA